MAATNGAAFGVHRRKTSETGYPLDRTQHDLAGGLVAKNAALTGTRFRCGGQMTVDISSMSFPKAGHIRGLRHARKGLVSCLRLETTEVLPGAVAVSSDGIQPCRSCLFHVKAQKYAAGSAERPLRVHKQGAPA